MKNLKDLVKAGVHFGHLKARWCPKMAPYIWGFRKNVHLIDVSKTAYHLEKAAQFLQSIAADGKSILWIGTKKAARDIITKAAQDLKMPYVNHRWIGGTLSNHEQVKKSITKMLHLEDVIEKAEKTSYYTKKELNTYQKNVDRLQKNVGGIRKLQWPLGAIVIIDVKKERSALKEAIIAGIPVVALVDTNSDPSGVDYVIPGNDDAPRSIQILVEYLVEATQKGSAVSDTKKKVTQEASQAKSAEVKKTAPSKPVVKTTESKAFVKKTAPKVESVISEKKEETSDSAAKPKK